MKFVTKSSQKKTKVQCHFKNNSYIKTNKNSNYSIALSQTNTQKGLFVLSRYIFSIKVIGCQLKREVK